MNAIFKAIATVAVLLIVGAVAGFAGDFDGTRSLNGVTDQIIEINRHRINAEVDPDTIGLPKKFQIDFKDRMLRPSKDSIIRKTISFKEIANVENMIVLQGVDSGADGVDDGLAWSLVISKKDGKAVLSASGDGVAYVVFGKCTPAAEE